MRHVPPVCHADCRGAARIARTRGVGLAPKVKSPRKISKNKNAKQVITCAASDGDSPHSFVTRSPTLASIDAKRHPLGPPKAEVVSSNLAGRAMESVG